MILVINFIHQYHLTYDTKTRGFFWKKSNNRQKGSLRVKKAQTLDSYSINLIQCDVRTDSGGQPKPGVPSMVTIHHEERPLLLMRGPTMITPDKHGHVYLPVVNAMFSPVDISKNEELGVT